METPVNYLVEAAQDAAAKAPPAPDLPQELLDILKEWHRAFLWEEQAVIPAYACFAFDEANERLFRYTSRLFAIQDAEDGPCSLP